MQAARTYVGGLRLFAAQYSASTQFTWASACSGSDIMHHVLRHLSKHWLHAYDIQATLVVHTWAKARRGDWYSERLAMSPGDLSIVFLWPGVLGIVALRFARSSAVCFFALVF